MTRTNTLLVAMLAAVVGVPALVAQGVTFTGPPREQRYGTVAVFEDLYGNRFDLIERPKDAG